MNLVKRNWILVCFSQIGAWILMLLLLTNEPLHILLFPKPMNNVPAVFFISVWLIQSLIIMNIIVTFINNRWIRKASMKNPHIEIKTDGIFYLHVIASIIHVIAAFIVLTLVIGGEDF